MQTYRQAIKLSHYRTMIPYRVTTRNKLALQCCLHFSRLPPLSFARWFSPSHHVAITADEAELSAARRWLENFKDDLIPEHLCDMSYSCSSGAGGQNVNKVNSKAQLRLPLQDLLPLIPSALHDRIRSHRYHAAKSESIVIQAQTSRKQRENERECFRKLYEMIRSAAKGSIPGEASPEQRARVGKMQRAEKEARLRGKKAQGAKKASRRRGGRSDD